MNFMLEKVTSSVHIVLLTKSRPTPLQYFEDTEHF